MADIGRSTSAHVADTSEALYSIENWAAWISSLDNAGPRERPATQPMFKDYQPKYRDPPASRDIYDAENAEILEHVICWTLNRKNIELLEMYFVDLCTAETCAAFVTRKYKEKCNYKRAKRRIDAAVVAVGDAYHAYKVGALRAG